MPDEDGFSTPSARIVATAASVAEPPSASTASPTDCASGWSAETAPVISGGGGSCGRGSHAAKTATIGSSRRRRMDLPSRNRAHATTRVTAVGSRLHVWTASIGDAVSSDRQQAGGKAAGLSLLARAGLPVPAGFVVLTSAIDSALGALPEEPLVWSDGAVRAEAARRAERLEHAELPAA